jgi:hypothetical protein
MKKYVILMSSALCAGLICLFSFRTPVKKPTTYTRFVYTGCAAHIDPVEESSFCCDNSLDTDFLTTTGYWSAAIASPTFVTNGAYLGAIEFDRELTHDGGGDEQMTINEALAAVDSYYNTHQSLPLDGQKITSGNTDIYIRRTDNNPCD